VIRMLASVRDLDEARTVLEAGVDLIDLKQPADGALGALPADVIREVVAFVAGRTLTSATAGNVEPDAQAVQAAMARIATTGVDYVKVGLFPAGWQQGGRDYAAVHACLRGLAPLAGARRIAVMFADLAPPLDLVDAVAAAGFDTGRTRGAGCARGTGRGAAPGGVRGDRRPRATAWLKLLCVRPALHSRSVSPEQRMRC